MRSQYWHNVDESQLHSALNATVDAIEKDQQYFYQKYLAAAQAYKEKAVTGLVPGQYHTTASNNLQIEGLEDPMTEDSERWSSYNVIRSATDTITAKISLQKPKIRFITAAGSEDLQKKAKMAEKFVTAVSEDQQVFNKGVAALRDACLNGHGLIKLYDCDNEVVVEKVHPSRVLVDNQAALSGKTSTMYQVEYISELDLLEMFPDKEDIISASDGPSSSSNYDRKLLRVIEGWKLKSKDKPGRHSIVIDNGVLFDEEYDRDVFPIKVIRYTDDIMGWYGIGLAEQLKNIQYQINSLLWKIEKNAHMLSCPYILLDANSGVKLSHIGSNLPVRIIETTRAGNPPQHVTPPIVHPQIFEHLEALYQRAFEIAGISTLSATSTRPEGITSGVALRTVLDSESTRFNTVLRNFQRFFVEIAEEIIYLANKLDENDEEGFEKRYFSNSGYMDLKWRDVSLEEQQYVLALYPASALPDTPGGKLERVVEMANAQMITPKEARQLLDYPDLEKFNDLANSHLDMFEEIFESFLEGGDYIPPFDWMGSELMDGIKLATQYLARATINKMAQSKRDILEDWIREAIDMMAPPEPTEEELAQEEAAGVPAEAAEMAPEAVGGAPVNEETLV